MITVPPRVICGSLQRLTLRTTIDILLRIIGKVGQGDATRFLDLYEAYAKAEDVTRRRLYLEAMENILPRLGDKYVVDADQKNLLPLLTLGKAEGGKK